MSFFKRLFGTTESRENHTPPESLFVDHVPPTTLPTAVPHVVKDINWIYEFINEDREQQGYEDAVSNPDSNYRADYTQLFWSSLSLRIKISKEHYDALLQLEQVHLDRCEKSGLLDTVAQLNKRMEHIREKVNQLNELAEKSQRQEGEGQRAILSYNRGFNKGLAALTQSHVSNHSLASDHPMKYDQQ